MSYPVMPMLSRSKGQSPSQWYRCGTELSCGHSTSRRDRVSLEMWKEEGEGSSGNASILPPTRT